VIRGGSWNNNAHNCRSANRNNNWPNNRNNNIGFRLCNKQNCVFYAFLRMAYGAILFPAKVQVLFLELKQANNADFPVSDNF
jgi:hypothetical protein